MNWDHAGSFVAQKEGSVSLKGMMLYGEAAFADFYPADLDASLDEVFPTFLEWVVGLKLDLFIGALIAEHVELFEYLDFLGVGPAGDEEYLIESEGTGTPDDIADVIAFADIVEEEIAFGLWIFHQQWL